MLRRHFTKKFKGMTFKSGHIYSFSYQAWQNDPKPTVIFMYTIEGIHPRTGNQHRYLQCINFTYIPRAQRRAFARDWTRIFKASNGDVRFTWEKVKTRYPYLQGAVRRYFFKPDYYLTKISVIPFEKMEQVIISTWSRDFSKKVISSLIGKYRDIMGRRKK